MANKIQVLPGERYHHLVVIKEVEKNKDGNRMVLCKCDCGKEKAIRLTYLRNGYSKSCGCGKFSNHPHLCKHGFTSEKTPKNIRVLYGIWQNMLYRCSNSKTDSYKYYGGRGISVCDDWKNDFTKFRDWSLENGYELGLSIDRINCDGNYEPSNCRWADTQTQSENRRNCVYINYNGETHTMAEWGRITGIPKGTIRHRYLIEHLSLEDVFDPSMGKWNKDKKNNKYLAKKE